MTERHSDKDRDAFEAHVRALPHWPKSPEGWHFERMTTGSYCNNRLQDMWDGWQAGRATVALPECGTPFGYYVEIEHMDHPADSAFKFETVFSRGPKKPDDRLQWVPIYAAPVSTSGALPQPWKDTLNRAKTMLESAAGYGMIERDANNEPTPNALLCKEIASDLSAILEEWAAPVSARQECDRIDGLCSHPAACRDIGKAC